MENKSFLQTYHPVEKYLPCNSLLRSYKHYIFPGLNLSIEELLKDEISPEAASKCYKQPLLNINRPIPCLSTKYIKDQDNPKEDRAMILVKKKHFWKKKKKNLQVPLNRVATRPVLCPRLVESIKGEEPITKLPYGVVRMADHLANNPDKYFKGVYNWYYGNALKNIIIADQHYLLYPSGNNLNELCMTFVGKPAKSAVVPQLVPQVSISLSDSDFIYDITANNCSKIMAARQRDSCSFLNYYEDEDGAIGFKNYLTIKSTEYPFLTIDNCDTEFCTINANRKLQFWNPDYLKHCIEHTTLPESDTKLPNKFVQVKYNSHNSSKVIVVVDRHNVYSYDRRQNYEKPCSHLKPDKQTEECEEISLLVPSMAETNWYLGMSHSCLLLDVRMGFAQRWTHMMSQPPSVGHAFRINKESHALKEAVILSTQATNETVALYRIEDDPESLYFPVRVPSRPETLHDACSNGVLTNLYLQNKFNFSTIGLTAYKMKKRMGIFSLVSTGDIFHQYVYPNAGVFNKNGTCLNEEELNYLENWENEYDIESINKKRKLVITRTINFSELVNSIDESIEIPDWTTKPPPKKAYWKVPLKKLHTYKDLLASSILNEYGLDDIEDLSSSESENENENKVVDKNIEKVQSWLSETYSQLKEADSDVPLFVEEEESNENDASKMSTVVELDLEVPPEFDMEILAKPKSKRRRH